MSDVHREHPEATEREIEAIQLGQLLRAPRTGSPADVMKDCRDCGTSFHVAAAHSASGSKWYSLCGSCLAGEL